MAIFGRNNFDIYPDASSMAIQPTIECGYEIMYQSYEELTKLEASMYIADIMIEEKVLHEGASEEVLTEGVLRTIVDKAKEIFKKIKAKLKEWFEKIKKTLFITFANIHKVIAKYETLILDRAKENPIFFDGYVYGDIVKVGRSIYDEIVADMGDQMETIKKQEGHKVDVVMQRRELRSDAEKYNKENVLARLRGSKEPKVNLSMKNYAKGMIEFIENYKNLSGAITKIHDDIQTTLDGIIKDLEKQRNAAAEEVQKSIDKQISAGKAYSKDAQMIMLAMTAVGKEMFRNYSMLLKKQAKAKSLKESYSAVETDENILEAAMELL